MSNTNKKTPILQQPPKKERPIVIKSTLLKDSIQSTDNAKQRKILLEKK